MVIRIFSLTFIPFANRTIINFSLDSFNTYINQHTNKRIKRTIKMKSKRFDKLFKWMIGLYIQNIFNSFKLFFIINFSCVFLCFQFPSISPILEKA